MSVHRRPDVAGPASTLREAVGTIPDGALISVGGFQLNRAPIALLHEIVRQGRRGLRLVSVPNPLSLDLLVGAGVVDEVEFGFAGFQFEDGFVMAPNLRRSIQDDAIRWTERDVYEIIQGFRAGATGLPFLPAPGGDGSDYRRVNDTPPVADPDGGECPVARAIRPDVALIHAQYADRHGNLKVSDLYADDLVALASRRVIATVERVVERIDDPTVRASRVMRVVEIPGGAFPTACHRFYPHSVTHLRTYLAHSSEGGFGDYLKRFVHETGDHETFLTAAGGPGHWERAGGLTGTVPVRAHAEPGAADRLVVGMSRSIADGDVVTTGVASALPMMAVALARRTRAPRATYINCVGAINPRIERASTTSVDAHLLDDCEGTVSLPGLFDMARRGEIDLMFFGAAQVDVEARINLTCIGDYRRPTIKLPGPAGSSSMRPYVRKVVIMIPRHSKRTLVERVDFATAVASPRNCETTVVTDLGRLVLRDGRLRLSERHKGVELQELKAKTGFDLGGETGAETPEPTPEEMKVLSELDPGGIRHRMA